MTLTNKEHYFKKLGFYGKSGHKAYVALGPYDPRSFMNCCYINRERKAINAYQLPPLSPRDLEALKTIYSELVF